MKLRKRSLWVIIFLAFALSAAGISYSISNLKDITLSQNEVQSLINKKLPKEFHKKLIKTSISDIAVNFSENQIELDFKGKIETFKKTAQFDAYSKGTLRYNDSNGGFYFSNPNVEIRELKLCANNIGEFKKELMSSVIGMAASVYLNNLPVYKLPDNFKGKTVKIFLKSVEIRNGSITIHLSFWQFSKVVLTYLVIGALSLAFAIALALNPEMLSIILFLPIGDQ